MTLMPVQTWSLVTVALALVAGALIAQEKPAPASRQPSASGSPNVVLILADDLGYGDLSCYGADTEETPNLDQLALEGMRFTDFYMSSPVCSPSRASVLTGCYHKRVSINRVLYPVSRVGLNPDEITIAEVLKRRGYATSYFGKWHLGDQKEFLPTEQGFDHNHGIPYSHDMKSIVRLRKEEGKLSPLHARVLPLLVDDRVEELVRSVAPLMETYEREAEAFMKECAERKQPFFIMMAHHAVHRPIHPQDDFLGTSENGSYGDWVQEIDSRAGNLMRKLDELNLTKDTIVIFTSDNGPSMRSRGTAGPLRGFKHTHWEGGVRVPFIIRWPGRIPAGTITSDIGASPDLLPTLASLTGQPIGPEHQKRIDGLDLSPLLLGKSLDAPIRDEFIYYNAGDLVAIRRGDWKYHFRAPNQQRGLLFNLRGDVGESTNVARQFPEVVEELTAAATVWQEQLGDRLKPGLVERPPGNSRYLRPLFEAVKHPQTEQDIVEMGGDDVE